MSRHVFNRRHRFGIWLMGRTERLLDPRFRKDYGDWLRFGCTYLPNGWVPGDEITVTRAS